MCEEEREGHVVQPLPHLGESHGGAQLLVVVLGVDVQADVRLNVAAQVWNFVKATFDNTFSGSRVIGDFTL